MGCVHKLFAVLHGGFAYFPHLYVYFIIYLYLIYFILWVVPSYYLILSFKFSKCFVYFFFSTFKFSGTIRCSGLILYVFFFFFFFLIHSFFKSLILRCGARALSGCGGGAPLVVVSGFPLRRLLLRSVGSRLTCSSCCGSQAVQRGLRRPSARGTFPDRDSNPRPRQWQAVLITGPPKKSLISSVFCPCHRISHFSKEP